MEKANDYDLVSHDSLDRLSSRGLGEQLEADSAGVTGLCQLVEHLGVVDLARTRLMAARNVRYMDVTELVSVFAIVSHSEPSLSCIWYTSYSTLRRGEAIRRVISAAICVCAR